MEKVHVHLRQIASSINLPTVLKTTILPGESIERLFIATQTGEIYFSKNGAIESFLNIRPRIIKLGASAGYDERGLLGLAFHPNFQYNGLFYLHYSAAGTQGPGALPKSFKPDPCDMQALNLKWTDREKQYDHIDTVEEWIYEPSRQPQKLRTLLNLRRPFFNHNGFNSLNFSPETNKLILTTGDGGLGYDPFNLSQDNMSIPGKIIEIDVSQNTYIANPPAVTRFDEIPAPVQESLAVIAKGVRNIPGIAFQKISGRYIKYAGNVGQELAETIFAFARYAPVPVARLVRAPEAADGLINFGWRAWEGFFPTAIVKGCFANSSSEEVTAAYYDEAVKTSGRRIPPLTGYFHYDPRPDKFAGTALTGVQSYMGTEITGLAGSVVFADFARKKDRSLVRGVLGYTKARQEFKPNDYGIIETGYNFGSASAYYVSLGTNMDQTRLYLGVYGSMKTTDPNLGSVFEIVP